MKSLSNCSLRNPLICALEFFTSLGSLSLSLRKNALSWECHLLTLFSSGPHPASCDHDEKKSHLASLHPFIILLLFIFFPWVRVLSYVCQRRQAQDSAKPANAHFDDSWTLSQSATSEKPFPAKTEDKGKSLNTKATQVQTPDFAVTGVILKIDFSLIENSMRVLNMWLMIVQVYAIAHIAVNCNILLI